MSLSFFWWRCVDLFWGLCAEVERLEFSGQLKCILQCMLSCHKYGVAVTVKVSFRCHTLSFI